MITDYKDAIKLVTWHLRHNPTSGDVKVWNNQLRNLKTRLAELQECMHLGEYDE